MKFSVDLVLRVTVVVVALVALASRPLQDLLARSPAAAAPVVTAAAEPSRSTDASASSSPATSGLPSLVMDSPLIGDLATATSLLANGGPFNEYRFVCPAGRVVQIDLTSPDHDSMLIVRDAAGAQIA